MDNNNLDNEKVIEEQDIDQLEHEYSEKSRSYKILFPLLFLLIFISIGFSYLSTNLNIFGGAGIGKMAWDVHFDNIEEDADNTGRVDSPAILQNGKTSIQFSTYLGTIGDKYGFTFEIVNEGTIDAMIESFSIQQLTDEQAKFLEYKVTYDNGEEIKPNDLLKASEKVKVHVTTNYKELTSVSQSVSLLVDFKYVQADENAVDRSN